MSAGDFLPSRGQLASIVMSVEGELTAQDLLSLAEDRGSRDYVPAVQRLTQRHHRQAQLIAEGYTLREVATIVGSTPERLTQLQRDPSFAELIAYYGDQRMVTAMDSGLRLRQGLEDVAHTTLEEIQSRLSPERIATVPLDELRKLNAHAADRTVAPPKVSQPLGVMPTSITLNLGTRDIRPEGKPEPLVIENDPQPEGKE